LGFWFPRVRGAEGGRGAEGSRGAEGGGRRAGWRRALAVLLLAALCVAAAWVLARLEGVGCRGSSGPSSFLLLAVTETNSGILRSALVPELAPKRQVELVPGGRRLSVAQRSLVPRGRYRALVVHLIEDFDVPVDERLAAVRRLPWRVELGSAVAGSAVSGSAVAGLNPVPGRTTSLDPSKELARGPLTIAAIDESGVVSLEHLGRRATLRPGETYARLWVDAGGEVAVLDPGDAWRKAVDDALLGRASVTRLLVENLGWWTRDEVSIGAEPPAAGPGWVASSARGGGWADP